MIKKKLYKYLGRNGILITGVQIEGANYIPVTEITAESGKLLTNNEKFVRGIIVEDENIDSWREISDKAN